MTARVSAWHFYLSDPKRADERWKLVVVFPGARKEDVPIGSKVMVSQQLKAAIDPEQISKMKHYPPCVLTADAGRRAACRCCAVSRAAGPGQLAQVVVGVAEGHVDHGERA